MKRAIAFALTMLLGVSLCACGGKKEETVEASVVEASVVEEPAAPEVTEEAADSETTDETAKTEATETAAEVFDLFTETGDDSVKATSPAGFTRVEGMSRSSVTFLQGAEDGTDTLSVSMSLLDGTTDFVSETKASIDYVSSANADAPAKISPETSVTIGGRTVSYLTYSYSAGEFKTEGQVFWTVLKNGTVFTCTMDYLSPNASADSFQSLMEEIIGGITEE